MTSWPLSKVLLSDMEAPRMEIHRQYRAFTSHNTYHGKQKIVKHLPGGRTFHSIHTEFEIHLRMFKVSVLLE